jgi:hypothetical protein
MKGNSSEVTALLQELSKASLAAIHSQNYSGALELLRSSSDIIDAVISSGGSIEEHQVLVTLNNSACCLQRSGLNRLSRNQEALWFIEACLFHTKHVRSSSLLAAMRLLKYECFLLLQACGLKSKLDQHSEALKAAQTALLKSLSLMKKLKGLAKKISMKANSAKSQGMISEKLANIQTISGNTLLIISDLDGLLKGLRSKTTRSIMGREAHSEWALGLCLTDIMAVSPLAFEDFKRPLVLKSEFMSDRLLLKITLIAVSYYCIGVEARQLPISSELSANS